jgi:hypothetical protein
MGAKKVVTSLEGWNLMEEDLVLLLQQIPVQPTLPAGHLGDGELCWWTCTHTCSMSGITP